MSHSKRMSKDGRVRVGQRWQDVKEWNPYPSFATAARTMEVVEIKETILSGTEYALVVITKPGYRPSNGDWHKIGTRGMIRVSRFTSGNELKLVQDAPFEVRPGQRYVNNTATAFPSMVRILSVGATIAYVEVLLPNEFPRRQTHIHLSRFFPGPDQVYQPIFTDQYNLAVPYSGQYDLRGAAGEAVREAVKAVSPTPPIYGDKDWSLSSPAHTKNPGEYDLIKKIAPDYVDFFAWLDKAKPYWRTWTPSMTILSDLLAAYDAGRASK